MRLEFPSAHYMFCHPQSSLKRIRRWKHLLTVSNLDFVVDLDPEVRIRLMYRCRVLEDCPVHIQTRIHREASYFSFKWKTTTGTFRFQVEILQGADHLMMILESLGLTVINTSSESSQKPGLDLNHSIENYKTISEAQKHIQVLWISRAFVSSDKPVRWEHIGRMSGLILSLNETKVVLSWNEKVVDTFLLDSKRLRAYYAEGIVGLKERRDNVFFHLQARIDARTVNFVCNWLEQKGIDMEDSSTKRGAASYAGTTKLTSGWDENPYP